VPDASSEQGSEPWPRELSDTAGMRGAGRDKRAEQADSDAVARDRKASAADAQADERSRAAEARETDAAAWIAAAHRRLIRADSRDAQLWAEAVATVEGARKAHAAAPTEATKAALQEAEARIDERTITIIGSGLERDEIRSDLDHASSDLAAASRDRISAERDRSRARSDRSAAQLDRQAAAADRRQSAIERASDPYLQDEDL
jgi:hypothetical protein